MVISVSPTYLQLHSNQTRGGWSTKDILQDKDPGPPAVICNSTHLTSFSVLISSSNEATEVLLLLCTVHDLIIMF